MEYLIQKLCDELKLDLEYTRSEVEKLANASEREIQLDKHLQREIENEFVNINEDDNDSEVQVSDDEGDDSLRIYLLDQMARRYHSGYINCKGYINNTNVKSVGILHIKGKSICQTFQRTKASIWVEMSWY